MDSLENILPSQDSFSVRVCFTNRKEQGDVVFLYRRFHPHALICDVNKKCNKLVNIIKPDVKHHFVIFPHNFIIYYLSNN